SPACSPRPRAGPPEGRPRLLSVPGTYRRHHRLVRRVDLLAALPRSRETTLWDAQVPILPAFDPVANPFGKFGVVHTAHFKAVAALDVDRLFGLFQIRYLGLDLFLRLILLSLRDTLHLRKSFDRLFAYLNLQLIERLSGALLAPLG